MSLLDDFSTINLRRDSKFFDLKVKNKEIFVVEERGEYVGHSCFKKCLIEPPFAVSVFGQELAIKNNEPEEFQLLYF